MSHTSLLVFLVLVAVTSAAVSKPANMTWTDKIRYDLLLNTNYDKYSRPHKPNNATTVKCDVTFTRLNVCEMKSLIIIDAWTKLMWNDAKLKWNPADYGGVESIHVADHEVWKPDIVLYNTADGDNIDNYGHTNCIVYSSGDVLWVPPCKFKSYCDLDLRRWPRDVQKCTLKMGSWTHHVDQIDLQIMQGNDTSDYMLTKRSEWELVSLHKERHAKFYPCCKEAYPDIEFTMVMKRRSPSFISLVVLPATVVVLLTLAGFWMPPQNGVRIVLNALTALIICDLQRAISYKLPDASGAIPYILMFYSACLALTTLALIVAVVSMNLSRCNQPPPAALKRLFSGFLGKLLCVADTQCKVELSPKHRRLMFAQQSRSQTNKEFAETANHEQEWLNLTRAIDHLAFYGCIVVFVVLALAFH